MNIQEVLKLKNKGKLPSPYDFIEIIIGNERLSVRPVGWTDADYDGTGKNIKGEEIIASKWHATCPNCAQLIELDESLIGIDDKNLYGACDNCGVNKDKVYKLKEKQKIDEAAKEEFDLLKIYDKILEQNFYASTSDDKFINPVAKGLMQLNE